jgi:hypothetical protein
MELVLEKYKSTDKISTGGQFVVFNPDCKANHCYGRGYTEILESKLFEKWSKAAEVLKEKGEIPPDWLLGQYVQCKKCYKWFVEQEYKYQLEKANEIKAEDNNDTN